MEINILKQTKEDIEMSINNLTITEILRVYLNKEEVDFAAWRREHPSKPILMKIQASNAKKAISNAISAIKKDCDKIASIVKK